MLQKEVFTGIAAGVPGDKATLNPTAYTVHNPIAEGTGVTVGNFVWPGTDVEHQAQVGGSGAPLGIVERLLVYPGACGAPTPPRWNCPKARRFPSSCAATCTSSRRRRPPSASLSMQ